MLTEDIFRGDFNDDTFYRDESDGSYLWWKEEKARHGNLDVDDLATCDSFGVEPIKNKQKIIF